MRDEYDNHTHDELVAIVRGLEVLLGDAEAALAESKCLLRQSDVLASLAASREEVQLLQSKLAEARKENEQWKREYLATKEATAGWKADSTVLAGLCARGEDGRKVCPHLTRDEQGAESCWARDTVNAYRAREFLRDCDGGRVERVARWMAADQHEGMDSWDHRPLNGYSPNEKHAYREKARAVLAVADTEK